VEHPPDSPMFAAAKARLWAKQERWNTACASIQSSQGYLKRAVDDWKHKLLGDIPADAFTVPPRLEAPEYSGIDEVLAAEHELDQKVSWIEAIVTAIDAVKYFDTQPRDQQALDLIKAVMVDRQAALRRRVIAIEGRLSAVEARLDRLERKNPSKSQRSQHSPLEAATA
jgi:hypothetical protein